MQKNIKTMELTPIKAVATKATKYATNLKITDDKMEKAAIEELSRINKIGDTIEEKKSAILKPLLASEKEIRELFKPLELNVKNAVLTIKEKLKAYFLAKEAKKLKDTAKINARVESGNLKMKTGVKKLNELAPLDTSVSTGGGSVQYKTVRKVRIINPKKVPAEYLVVDEPKVRQAALALKGLGELIPGVEVYEDKEINNRRK